MYDPKVYKEHIDRLQEVCKVLEGFGFKTKMSYTKDYEKRTLKKEPEGLWITVSW